MPAPRAQTTALPPITLIGSGRVGNALARTGRAAGLEVRLTGRSDLSAALADAGIALLCVPDAEIESACAAVAAVDPPTGYVGHTSGAGTLDLLVAATRAGSRAFSLHPLQTVPDGDTDLAGAPAAVAGSDQRSVELATRLARALGLAPFEIPEASRAAYHAAASIASNFLVALEESAAALLADCGVENARELLTPLVLRTALNWSERGAAGLTGPIARGDRATVERHAAAIEQAAPELSPLYRALAARTAEIAAENRAARA